MRPWGPRAIRTRIIQHADKPYAYRPCLCALVAYARLRWKKMKRAKFDKAAGDAIGAAVREIEAKTNAEIVVAVRGRSGTYRHADYLFGAIVAFIGLLL